TIQFLATDSDLKIKYRQLQKRKRAPPRNCECNSKLNAERDSTACKRKRIGRRK
ncbi:unnamed protein product, partial [Oikopleura dioica]